MIAFVNNNQQIRKHFLHFAAAALVLLVARSSAVASDDLALQSDGLPPLSVPAEFIPSPPVIPDFSPADLGFWQISTHASPQSFDYSCPRFCPGVQRYDACVGFRRATFQELCGSLEPGVPVCIVIHGSFMDLPSTGQESQMTWKWLRSAAMGQRMQMIYLTWPSDRPMFSLSVPLDVTALGRRAARNGYYLAELIHHIPQDCPISLVGHSHGTRVIASGLHLLSGGFVQGVQHPFARVNGRRIRAVFAAAAMDHHWLNPSQRYGRALCSAECILNLTNRQDYAMHLYPLRLPLFVKRPLGQTGLTASDRAELGGWGRRFLDWDVTAAVGHHHLWPNYYQHNGLAMLIRNYVYFPDAVPSVGQIRDVRSN